MQVIKYPDKSQWPQFTRRPAFDQAELKARVQEILRSVQEKGDEALFGYTKQFDGVQLDRIRVNEAEILDSGDQLDTTLKLAIQLAYNNIYSFHKTQLLVPEIIETSKGVQCWRKSVGIEKVGLYIPGGTAPLFSTILMLGIPAKIAGCREIVLCTPPDKSGRIHPAILYAASLVGISVICKLGGVQAIAAMTYGTASVPGVYKLFGPGNQFVTAAKQLVQQAGMAIDMPAGPSEVAVFADSTANPVFVAADLLSQAEHGADSQVLLVTTDADLIVKVQAAMEDQLTRLPRMEFAKKSLANSNAVLVNSATEALEILNEYAPEHLILASDQAPELAELVVNAGSVFIGHYSPESAGDYASGTNHTLPTNGFAKVYSGVSVDSFVKKISFQQIDKSGLHQIAEAVISMAEAESLQAHAEAIRVRL